MKKLELTDLTPEFMKKIAALGTAEDVVSFCEKEGFSIKEKPAAALLEQLAKADSLTEEQLKQIAGGWNQWKYGDT